MKKPILATLGIAGACAACCAIPIALPLISGLSVAGLVGFDWQQFTVSREFLAVAAGSTVAIVAGLAMWSARRRRAASACASSGSAPVALQTQTENACGCTGSSNSAPAGGTL